LARRKRRVFAHIGAIVVVILLAMCAMGIAYGAWKDTPYIDGTVITGTWSLEITGASDSHDEITTGYYNNTLEITLNEAPALEEGQVYSCSFTIANIGTIPIKIKEIEYSSIPEGVNNITNSIVVGLQLDDYDAQAGTVTFTVEPPDTVVSGSFTISFTGIEWNLFP